MNDERRVGQRPEPSMLHEAALKSPLPSATDHVVEEFCQRLPCMVRFRLDPRVVGRIAVSEVVEEIANSLRLRAANHRCRSDKSLFLCLRAATMVLLDRIQREYLGCQYQGPVTATLRLASLPGASTRALATALLCPCGAAPDNATPIPVQQLQLQQAFNRLDANQREILAMRHFEQLSCGEVASVLNLPVAEVGSRYIATLARLRSELKYTQAETLNQVRSYARLSLVRRFLLCWMSKRLTR